MRKRHKIKTTKEETKYTSEIASKIRKVKHKHKKKVTTEAKYVKNKYMLHFEAKRETEKTTVREMLESLERERETVMEQIETTEKLGDSKETEIPLLLETKKRGKYIITHKDYLRDTDKKHLTTKYDRNRDRWREENRKQKERQLLEDKERLKQEEDIKNKLTLKYEDRTTDSYTSNEMQTKLAERQPNEYNSLNFFS